MWLESDTEAVLEWLREQALICSGCGHPRDETMQKEADGKYTPHILICHACAANERALRKFMDERPKATGVMAGAERDPD